ncbi:hypothetical protein ABVK25_006234 [Lepraria finkii]|uniref:Uncharacterized protein n=1 Tax=Lepraria finkii TaxID=1340010 RepID=A0ABR4B9N1_9LECA
MSNISDVPPVPKLEPFEEESFSESSPEPEEQSLTQEPAQVQKRKGGRKPVRISPPVYNIKRLIDVRYMQPQRNASKEIVRHRPRSGNDGPNT